MFRDPTGSGVMRGDVAKSLPTAACRVRSPGGQVRGRQKLGGFGMDIKMPVWSDEEGFVPHCALESGTAVSAKFSA